MTIETELNQIISLLEAQIPANPRSPKNERLRRGLQRKLAKYFDDIEKAFPYGSIDKLYNQYVTESLNSQTGDMLDRLLGAFNETLETTVGGELTQVYISGTAEMTSWGKTKGGIPISYEGPPVEGAISFAKTQGAKLITQMDEETKRRLAGVISNGIKDKRGIPGIQRDLRKAFTDMSRHRAELIARTETANALSTASLDSMKDMGIEGKEWVWPGTSDCGICSANAAAGVIPVNQAFPSGDMAPPAHPNCECALAPALLPKAADKRLTDAPEQVKKSVVSGKMYDGKNYNLINSDLKKISTMTPDEVKRATAASVDAAKEQLGRRYGLIKREEMRKALKPTTEYRLGLGQGKLDHLNALDYTSVRKDAAFNMGYYEGYGASDSNLFNDLTTNVNFFLSKGAV